MRDEVLQLLGAVTPPSAFSADGEIVVVGQAYELVLETTVETQRGLKNLRDPSCVALAQAAAALIALAIDPTLVLPPERVPPAVASATPTAPAEAAEPAAPPPAAPPTAAPPPASSLKRSSSIDGYAQLAAVGEAGTVPGLSAGALLLLEARLGYVLFALGGEYLAPQRTTLPESPELGAVVGYWGGKARACVGPFARKLAPAGCAGVGLGRLNAESRGAPIPGSGSMRWFTPELGASVRYRVSDRILFGGSVDLRFAVEDSQFTLDNVGPVYAPESVAVAVQLGAVAKLW